MRLPVIENHLSNVYRIDYGFCNARAFLRMGMPLRACLDVIYNIGWIIAIVLGNALLYPFLVIGELGYLGLSDEKEEMVSEEYLKIRGD